MEGFMKFYGENHCEFCNTKFLLTSKHQKATNSRKGKRFCSKVCKSNSQKQLYASERIKVTCKICQKEELINKAGVKSYKTCSMACLCIWQSQKLKGKKKPASWHEKQKTAKQRENVRVEGSFPCGACGKIFESNTSLRAHRTHCQKGVSFGDWKCDLCDKKFDTKNSLGIHMRWHQRTKEELLEIGENIRVGQSHSEFVMPRVSNAEREFLDKLSELLCLKVERGYKISNYHHEFDGYIKELNLLIEFDGDYWHGNPLLYDMTPRMKSQRYKDWQHNVKVIEEDYNILRVYQSESHTLLEEIKEHGAISKNKINQEKCQRDPSIRSTDQEKP